MHVPSAGTGDLVLEHNVLFALLFFLVPCSFFFFRFLFSFGISLLKYRSRVRICMDITFFLGIFSSFPLF